MNRESSKARARRECEHYFERYLRGRGIDIGCGDDPVTETCLAWDLGQGDAAKLPGIVRHEFDWVYSSHCLEHLVDPWRAIGRWWEVLKPGGHLLVVVPDEDLYEQGQWPSCFNGEHKWTFTIDKDRSWSPVSINLTQLISTLRSRDTIWIRRCDNRYDYAPGIWDRTAGDAEAHIEVLLRKEPD